MTLTAALQADGIQLELLTGPLTGIYDPDGLGSMLFAVLAVAAQLEVATGYAGIRIRCAVLAGQRSVGKRSRALVRSASAGRVGA